MLNFLQMSRYLQETTSGPALRFKNIIIDGFNLCFKGCTSNKTIKLIDSHTITGTTCKYIASFIAMSFNHCNFKSIIPCKLLRQVCCHSYIFCLFYTLSSQAVVGKVYLQLSLVCRLKFFTFWHGRNGIQSYFEGGLNSFNKLKQNKSTSQLFFANYMQQQPLTRKVRSYELSYNYETCDVNNSSAWSMKVFVHD